MAVTDNFTGTDDATLDTAKWTVRVGTFVYKTNQCYPGFNQNNFVEWTANTFNANQYAQIVRTGGEIYIGPAVRLTGTGGTLSGYYGMPRSDSSRIYRVDNGTHTIIHNGSAANTAANPQTYKLDITGTSLTFTENGVTIGSVTDATYGTGGAGLWGNDQTNTTRGDSFEAGGETVAGWAPGAGALVLAGTGIVLAKAILMPSEP
jgi:hypothetical protein